MSSMTDIRRLRALASSANQHSWGLETHERGANITYCPHGVDCVNSRHDPYLAQDLDFADAEYLCAIPPRVLLKLLDELEALRGKRVQEDQHGT